MRLPSVYSRGGREAPLGSLPHPLRLDELVPGAGAWEVEIGFGKGRYLLRRAAEEPQRRFLGIELVSKYYRMAVGRSRRRGLANLLLLRGEALTLLATVLPGGFAAALHVYFPDPWPKSRHHRRRLFDAETVDLPLGALAPGGVLHFATDHLEYGERVAEILAAVPGVTVTVLAGPWPEGARTNYEAKYELQGRAILRLTARCGAAGPAEPFHPAGRAGIVAAVAPRNGAEAG